MIGAESAPRFSDKSGSPAAMIRDAAPILVRGG
jgi:hypothetical protein